MTKKVAVEEVRLRKHWFTEADTLGEDFDTIYIPVRVDEVIQFGRQEWLKVIIEKSFEVLVRCLDRFLED